MDLIDLHGGVDQETQVVEAKTDELNGVFVEQGIVHQQQLVEEAKDEERGVGGHCTRLGRGLGAGTESKLEGGKDVADAIDMSKRPSLSEVNGVESRLTLREQAL